MGYAGAVPLERGSEQIRPPATAAFLGRDPVWASLSGHERSALDLLKKKERP
jgi:hypothetical protein